MHWPHCPVSARPFPSGYSNCWYTNCCLRAADCMHSSSSYTLHCTPSDIGPYSEHHSSFPEQQSVLRGPHRSFPHRLHSNSHCNNLRHNNPHHHHMHKHQRHTHPHCSNP